MTKTQFWKALKKAEQAQATIEKFMYDFNDHFAKLDIYDMHITYCEGDGFLILNGMSDRGDVYKITKENIDGIYKLKTQEQAYDFFDKLKKGHEGI